MKKRARAPKSHQEFLVKTTMARTMATDKGGSSTGDSEREAALRRSPRGHAKENGNIDPKLAARKRHAHEVRKQTEKAKRQQDPHSEYTEDEDSSDIDAVPAKKPKTKARKSDQNDPVELASAFAGSFDIKLAAKKAQDVAAGERAFLFPGWDRTDTELEKQQKVYDIFFARNLELPLETASRAFLKAAFKPNSGSKCAPMARGKILQNAYLMFGKSCWANMTSLIIMSLGWEDFSSVNTWHQNFLPNTVAAIRELVPPPVCLFTLAEKDTDPSVPTRSDVKEACTPAVYASMKEHVTFLRLLNAKYRTGRVMNPDLSLRRQPELFGKFALMAVLSCSGTNPGVVTRRATALANGDRTFGKFNLPHCTRLTLLLPCR